MHVISRKTLQDFWGRMPDSEVALRAWFHEAEGASWQNSAELKSKYGSASIVSSERVVFNICGNKYRIVVLMDYIRRGMLIRFVGTHEQYDKIGDIEHI